MAGSATVSAGLVRALEALEVRVAFGLPGVHNLALWDALRDSPIDLVGVRHEQTAGYAADGLARVTGALGVAITTTGPGAANVVTATGEAWASGSPVLVITTDIPSILRRPGAYRGALHETTDQAGMFAPVVKATVRITEAHQAAGAVLRAGELALTAPAAPVYVEIPTDLLSAPADDVLPERLPTVYPEPSEVDLDAAAAVLMQARRPLVWVGRGAAGSGTGQAIEQIAERLAAPVIETVGARGLISPSHPCRVGPTPHLPEVGALWDQADAVLAIGTNFSGTITQNWAMPMPEHLISVNILPEPRGYDPEIALVGDAGAVTGRLSARLAQGRDLSELESELRELRASAAARLRREDVDAMALLDDLESSVPADTPLAVDMCIPGYWIGAIRTFSGASSLAYPIGWGTLGFGFPASIGMALARRQPTLCVCGDGGFLYACGELSTLAEQRPPLTVLIVDDDGYGMLRYDQVASGRRPFGVDFPPTDFVALARSFGVTAELVEGLGEPLRRALSESLAADEPRVLVLKLALRPPESTSPRWYRRAH
jgi:acetolactate synthase-1/2/3 large subunit